MNTAGIRTAPAQPPHVEALIDLAAYRHNLTTISEQVAPARLMAVVKADAYGHGLERMVRAALGSGIRLFGALDLPTAFVVCKLDADVDVFVWLHSPLDDFTAAVDAGIDLGVSTVAEVEAVTTTTASRPARLHLKIDTGLHRNGASESEWPGVVAAALAARERGTAELRGVWTHIAEASDDEDTRAMRRFDRAIEVAGELGARFELRHLAASAAGFGRSDSRYDVVRVGAFTYGIAPGGGIGPASLGLIPVMTLTSRVDAVVRDDGRSRVTVPVGYGDGLPGELAGRASVAIGGQRYLISSVEVDRLVVEADLPESGPSEGEAVYLFGSGDSGEQTLQDWADALGTIGEEFVVRLGPRVVRRYINE